jgi:hypothetical protein
VVYERALIRWQRVMFLKMLCFTNVFRRECNIDKRGLLQRFIQGSGIQTQENFKLNDNEIYLKHTSLSILCYNMTEQGSMTLQLEFETS